ncbi:TetR/AcrR family transcriptional regulator [Micromonospora sp. B11E3]|uniref:TetR/AcrR family transcriptional regulator n=1 Tax=Micromonospora sp. B11E3 TaxID=3153562 RepID=UPI00325D4F03
MGERLTRAQQQQRTRQRLLDAAETLFAERGIHQTSLEEVAAEAELTKGAIYANFDGKHGLLAAILERRYTDQVADAGLAVDPGAAADSLGDSYESVISLPETRRFAMALLEFWLYSMRTPAARDAMAQWLQAVREHNAKRITERTGGQPPIPASQLAILMTALDVGVALQHLIDPEGVPADVYALGLKAIMDSGGAGG